MNRRRPSEIKLLLVGTFIFTNGCTASDQYNYVNKEGCIAEYGCSASDQYNYVNKEDCIAEWGVEKCEKNGSSSRSSSEKKGSSSSSGNFFTYTDGSRTQRLNTRAFSVQRGGFGTSFGKYGGGS